MKRKAFLFLVFIAVVIVFVWLGIYIPRKATERIETLERENEILRSDLLEQGNTPFVSREGRYEILSTQIFSTYPTNERNLITVDAGSADGIEENMPVIVAGDTLVGRISKVYKHQSVVQTIFDPGWSLSVRIGAIRQDALLVGGPSPRVQFIEKDAEVEIGDRVLSADQSFPLNLLIGEVVNIDENPAEAFSEAVILPDLKVNTLDTLSIITDFLSR